MVENQGFFNTPNFSSPNFGTQSQGTAWDNVYSNPVLDQSGLNNQLPTLSEGLTGGLNQSGGGGFFGGLDFGSLAGGLGNLGKGVGGLAQAWTGLQNLKLAKQAYADQNKQWQANFDRQQDMTNMNIANQNARQKAIGSSVRYKGL